MSHLSSPSFTQRILGCWKAYRLDFAIVLGFLLLSVVYFYTPLSNGLVLGGHDTVAGIGQGQERAEFLAATGEETRWTNSIFSGMPTYQIAPSYGSSAVLNTVARIAMLFTTGPVSYLLLYLLGFYLLLRAFSFRPLLSALGAVAWALSSYFLIIIAAGHLWKVATLGFIPPTMAGLVLAYRGRYLWGLLTTAVFTGLQVLSNHLQMTYYFLFPMLFIVIAYGVEAVRKGQLRHWAKASAAVLVGGLLGGLLNVSNLYHTWDYAQHSMRGRAELTAQTPATPAQDAKARAAHPKAATAAHKPTDGLDRDYITQWSYGWGETMTLMIPDYKGGGTKSILERDDAYSLPGYDDFYQHAGQLQQATGNAQAVPGLNQYWGNQPFTVGPVYVGAIICFLFVLGLFLVRGPMKWALLAATVLSFLFAWGRNFMSATDFFIDYLPMYAKFRTVSSALVIAEFTLPLLAVMALAQVLREPTVLLQTRRGRVGLGVSFLLTGGLCLLLALRPSFSTLLSEQDASLLWQLYRAGLPMNFLYELQTAITTMHGAILSSSAWRSFLLIAVACLLIVAYCRWHKTIPAWSVVTLLLLLTLGDLWNIDKRYLNNDSFVEETQQTAAFRKSPADSLILDYGKHDPDFRVLNLSGGSPFNETTNETSYWHKSVGGYHAAKLHRYQDLIDRHLARECTQLQTAISQKAGALAADSVGLMQQGVRTQQDLIHLAAQQLNTDTICPVLNMLNTRWLILGGGEVAFSNERAMGNGWFVQSLSFADNADSEMAQLGQLATQQTAAHTPQQEAATTPAQSARHNAVPALRYAAVADAKFKADLDGSPLGEGRVQLQSYQPNRLVYTTESAKGGVAVFSEIYYPGWTATVDGKAVPIGRANYVLRALRLPAGKHEVVFSFAPASIQTTEMVSFCTMGLLLLLALGLIVRSARRSPEAEADDPQG